MNLTPEQKQAELQRHRGILLATIDYKLASQRGSIVFDQVDWIVEHWEQERIQQAPNVNTLLKRKRFHLTENAGCGYYSGAMANMPLLL